MTRPPARRRELPRIDPGDALVVGLIVLALVLGGGGSPSPLPEMLLEWLALAALVAVAALPWQPLGPWPWLAAGALLLVPLLQLVPLPPSVWEALPGREGELAALRLIGEQARWMPLSVDPPRTLAGLLSLIVPVVAMLLTARATQRGRALVMAAVAVMALASVLVGAAQLAGGPNSALRFYAHSHREALTGFQANRNATADVLLVGLAALAAWWQLRGTAARSGCGMFAVAAAALLAGGVVLTASRAGIALLALVGLVALALRLRVVARRKRLIVGGGLGLLLATAVALIRASPVLRAIAARFASGDDPRPTLWSDTLYAISLYWPWGSGVGTFVPVFVAAEALEAVDPSYPNRAHNDFLELALEAGIPGFVVLAGFALLLGWRLWRRWRDGPSRPERVELVFAGAVLAVVTAHSLVDYPLRSMALAALAGVAAGLILTRAGDRPALRGPDLAADVGTDGA